MARLWRVHHPDAVAGAELLLDREESHHIREVLRLRTGDAVAVFDGRGQEWTAEIVALDRGGVRVTLGDERTDAVEPALVLRLYVGLCRADRMEWLVQKATEVGVAAIHPVRTLRAERRGLSARRIERWRRIAREACKQCGRRRVPDLDPRERLPGAPVPPEVLALVLHPARGAVPLGETLRRRGAREVWLLVGPEPGLDPAEVAALERSGWRPATLGPRTLRAESAGVVAAAIVLHAWADLG